MATDQPNQQPAASKWVAARPWLILLGLTTYAAFARFFWLDRPTLWGDELATYYRTAGSYEHMMNRLEVDGFVPLHYLIYWWFAQHVTMTPFWMRLVPAAAGTLFVPAVFLLARGLSNNRVALWAAALAATSAYGMTYSRDAKMYMPTWTFATLGAGLLLWWLRQRGWRQWPLLVGWIICGAASVWFHASALIVIALYPLCLLIRLPAVRWYQPLLLIVGLGAILGGPWWYYTQYNRFIARSGIIAIDSRAEEEDATRWGHSGLDWVARHNRGQTAGQLVLNSAASYLLGIQWPREGVQDPHPQHIQPADWFKVTASIVMSLVLGLLLLGALPRFDSAPDKPRGPPPTITADPGDTAPDVMDRGTGWRGAVILAVWIIIPTYVFYCRSFEDFASPFDWLASGWSLMGWLWVYTLAGVIVVAGLAIEWRWMSRFAAAAAAVAVIGAVTWGVISGGATWLWPALDWLGRSWVLGPVLSLVIGGAWHASGRSFRSRLRALGRLLLCVVVLFTVLTGCHAVMDVLYQRAIEGGADHPWASIWMPRYLAVIFPAVLVAAVMLLMRLPTRPIQIAAVCLLIGLNLTQGWARIILDTQPPDDRIAEDIIAGRDEQGVTRTVLNIPGNGGLTGRWYDVWRVAYYITVQVGLERGEYGPDIRQIERRYRVRADLPPEQLVEALERVPHVQRLIVWEAFDHQTHRDALGADDPYLDALGPQWSLTGVERIGRRDFWNWRWAGWYRRREYTRIQSLDASEPLITVASPEAQE